VTPRRSWPCTLSLLHVVTSQRRHEYVTALTSLGDHVFAVRWFGRRVEVYDSSDNTFPPLRHIAVPGLDYCHGLAACDHHRCLYVSDGYHHSVHRVELSGSSDDKKWPVSREPRGLSVNTAQNVVVACCGANVLQEFTTHGTLVREICLQGLTNPWQAVQLSSGHYAVSQFTSSGLVGVVAADGQVLRSCGKTSDAEQLRYPKSLAVTKNDDILVADDLNNRVLTMNGSSLSSVEQLVLPVDGGMQESWALCLDEQRRRLYVGEQNRLMVFDVTFQVDQVRH